MQVSPVINEQGHITAFNVSITHEEATECGFYDENGKLLELEISAHPRANAIAIRGIKVSVIDKWIAEEVEKEHIKIAKRMLKTNELSTEYIAELTHLEIETVKQLQAEWNQESAQIIGKADNK